MLGAMSPPSRRRTVALTVVAALIIVGGFQALLYQRDTAGENKADAARTAADRAYATCLTEWGNSLTDALQRLQTANSQLDAAEVRKDDALDQLINLSNQAQQQGATSQEDLPPEFIRRYETTLAERVDAQRDFNRLKRDLARTREANPFVAPRVRCRR